MRQHVFRRVDYKRERQRDALNLLSTILVSIITATSTSLVIGFMIKPLVDQHALKREIAQALIMYASSFANPGYDTQERLITASDALRLLAARLRGSPEGIAGYQVWAVLGLAIAHQAIDEAAAELIRLSNSLFAKDREQTELNMRAVAKIRSSLGING